MIRNTITILALIVPGALWANPAPAVVRIQIRTPRIAPVVGPAPVIRQSGLPMIFPGPAPIVRKVDLPGQYHPIPSQPRIAPVPVALPTFPAVEQMLQDDDKSKKAEDLAKKIFDNQGKDLPAPVDAAKPARRVVIEESELLDQIGQL